MANWVVGIGLMILLGLLLDALTRSTRERSQREWEKSSNWIDLLGRVENRKDGQ